MKKILSLFLALVLLTTIAVPAMAATPETIDSITIGAPKNAADSIKDLQITLTKVNGKARIDSGGRSLSVFLYEDSTITFSRDVIVSRVASFKVDAEVTPVGKYEGGRIYTLAEYNSLQREWFAGVSDIIMKENSFASMNQISQYENHNINNPTYTEIDLRDFSVTAAAPTPTTTPTPAPVSVPKLESVSESTIEIPDSNGTRFTFSNIHNGFVGEYDSLDDGLMFGYANGASVICNKDVYLYEFTASNNGVSFYHYYTYKYDQGKLLKTFAAGTAIDVSSMTPENSEYSLDKMTFVTQNKSGYGRQIHLYPANTILEWGADDPDIFYPLSLFAVEKQPEPKPEVGIPSAWAVNSVNTAKSLGLATPELTNGYQAATTRAEFCRAAVNFLRTYGFDVDSVTPKLFTKRICSAPMEHLHANRPRPCSAM